MAWEEAMWPGLGLNRRGVALVFCELIEADQMSARAVQKVTKELVEEGSHRKPFRVLAHPLSAEKAIEVGEYLDVTQVAAEESQATSASQGVGSDLNTIEQEWAGIARRERSGHDELAPFGLRAVVTVAGPNLFYTSNLAQRVSSRHRQNRSV